MCAIFDLHSRKHVNWFFSHSFYLETSEKWVKTKKKIFFEAAPSLFRSSNLEKKCHAHRSSWWAWLIIQCHCSCFFTTIGHPWVYYKKVYHSFYILVGVTGNIGNPHKLSIFSSYDKMTKMALKAVLLNFLKFFFFKT